MDTEAEIYGRGARESPFRLLTAQIGQLHKDLRAFQTRTEQHFNRIDRRFDRLDARFDRIEGRLGHADSALDNLRSELPWIIREAMREVLREQKGNL